MLSILLLIISALLFYIVYYAPLKPKNFPPGPRWLPIVGSAPQLKSLSKKLGYQHSALSWLSEEFDSKVIGLCLGSQLTIAVSGYHGVKQILTREDFEGRPDTFFIRLRSMGTRKGITCTDGPHWHEQRSFAVRHLRNLGFGKRTMEALIQEQVDEILVRLQAQVGVAMCPDFAPSVMSVLWALTAGSKFGVDDAALVHLLDLMQRRSQAFDISGGVLSQFPWIRFIAPDASGYTLLNTVNSELHAFFQETICEHQSRVCKDDPRDLIDSYLIEMEKRKDEEDSTFSESQLTMVCLDMFVAGSTTTSNSLSFALLYISLFTDVQAKIHEELDANVGRAQTLVLADQNRLPYLSAVLLEVSRFCNVTPVAGPRRALRDTELLGYSIPKDTMVLLNMWSVHNDPEHWGDPHIFRPERFLDNDRKLKPDEWLMPFGLGKRRCLGETLARGCIFLFTASVLQKFKVHSTLPTPCQPPPPLPGITLSPPNYKIILENRI